MRQSFIVNIQNQQNATWQGTVTWVDEGTTQSFRSVLELIRLIDSALISGSKNETKDDSYPEPTH